MSRAESRHGLQIIHYNDVYNINVAPSEPVGGAARFVTAIRSAIRESPVETLVLFSGDAFSPAPLTPLTEGSEIPPILNATSVDVACIGNHEMDRGMDVLKERINETNFPWLVSNVIERRTGAQLADLPRTHVLKRGALTVGVMGLAGEDWIATLGDFSADDLIYTDPVDTANELSAKLRECDGCDLVVALSHMRQPDDIWLAKNATDLDIVLGGHDHVLWKRFVNNRWVLKSGTDFRHFSTIDILIKPDGRFIIDEPQFHAVTSDVEPDPFFDAFVTKYLAKLGEGYFDTLAISTTYLDGRFVSIRTKETGLGNLICDALASEMKTSISFINSGSYRSDTVEQPGPVTRQTVDSVLPYQDEIIVTRYKGDDLIQILENSVSQYPMLDGRFLQVSGIWFSFDPRKPAGQRIIISTVRCRAADGSARTLQLNETYVVATKMYIHIGKDGYAPGDPYAILSRGAITLPNLFVKYLRSFPRSGSCNDPVISPSRENRIVCLCEDPGLLAYYRNEP